MKLRLSLALPLLLPAVLFLSGIFQVSTAPTGLAGSAAAQDKDDAPTGGLPPLKVDRSAPLLLGDHKENEHESKAALRLNHACYVCHTNFKVESMANRHAEEEIGCMDCHGECFDHRNDEDNITPPDVMYALDEINAACQDCHDEHDVWPQKVIERWLKRCPDKKDMKQLVCTDCHGSHRLERRVVRWNKKTGELIVEEKKAPGSGN